MLFKPHVYQQHGIDHLLNNSEAGLFLDMGLGKTAITLTGVNELMYELGSVNKCLVIAPKRVAENTWTEEIAKWDHLKNLRVSKILGSEKKRIEGLKTKADLYLINRENVVWLVAYLGGAWPFDMVVLDELSSFKDQSTMRFKALKQVRPYMKRVAGLTGTPVPNGLIDLWPQLYLLDQGTRLGKTVTGFREAYFRQPFRNQGVVVRGYEPIKGSEDLIYDKIRDICISMKAKDWLDLPERMDIITPVILSPKILQQYAAFEREQVMELIETGETVTAVNAGALTNKLLQFANGAIYTSPGKKDFYEIHNEKIEALAERIEAANGQPVLVFYRYQSDVVRIMKHLKSMKPHKLETKDLADWNKKKIPFALAHPASFGHGLNMQMGGHLIEWFSRPWGSELYLQSLARLDRQGQIENVISNSLPAFGTLDYDVIASTDNKIEKQNALMYAVRALIKKHKNAA